MYAKNAKNKTKMRKQKMEKLQFKAGVGGAALKESQSCQYCAAISQPEKAFKYKNF